MKIKCEYCGGYLSDTDEKCPNCGGVNQHLLRGAQGVPKTIDELKAFCQARQLPLEKMRFFIGENYQKPRAFGIYRDANGDVIVYKNKADGSRAVRYRGKDEAYAVHELYQKLKSEALLRGKGGKSAAQSQGMRRRKGCGRLLWLALLVALLCAVAAIWLDDTPTNGYYSYNGGTYYAQNGSWYEYGDGGWSAASTLDGELAQHAGDYWQSGTYSDDYPAEAFPASEYSADPDASGSDWDDSDWDSGWDDSIWDSGGSDWDVGHTDWDSDW